MGGISTTVVFKLQHLLSYYNSPRAYAHTRTGAYAYAHGCIRIRARVHTHTRIRTRELVGWSTNTTNPIQSLGNWLNAQSILDCSDRDSGLLIERSINPEFSHCSAGILIEHSINPYSMSRDCRQKRKAGENPALIQSFRNEQEEIKNEDSQRQREQAKESIFRLFAFLFGLNLSKAAIFPRLAFRRDYQSKLL